MNLLHLAASIVPSLLSIIVMQLDGAMLSLALPSIGHSFYGQTEELHWVLNAYTIGFVCTLISAGALVDRVGLRWTFVGGFILFAVSALAGAVAPSLTLLFAARTFQGAGAAIIMPSSLALIDALFRVDGATRARAVSLWAAAGGAAVTVGPLVSGLLIENTNWRLVLVFSAGAAMLGAWSATKATSQTSTARDPRSFDWGSQILLLIVLGLLVYGITSVGHGNLDVEHMLGIVAAWTVALFVFLRLQRLSKTPVMPEFLYKSASLRAVLWIQFVGSFVIFGLVFALAIYFQHEKEYTPTVAGLAFLPFSICLVLTNLLGARAARRWQALQLLRVGLLVAILGVGLLGVFLNGTRPYAAELPAQILARIGFGLIFPMTTTVLLALSPREASGVASGALMAVHQVGSAVGVATFGALMSRELVSGLQTSLFLATLLLISSLAFALTFLRSDPPTTSSRAGL